MQRIYQKISLYFNCIFDICISTFFIKTIIISILFLNYSILSKEKKIFFNKSNEEKNITLNKNNKKDNIQYRPNYQIIQNKSDFISHLSSNTFITKTIYIKKNSNFFNSAYKSGLRVSDINTIVKAIEWQTNFRKLKTNSTFNLIFLKNHTISKNNTNILLGIKLNNFGKTYYAIRAFNDNFYNQYGDNKSTMVMDFSWLKKYRISSHFNLHRLHPITHHISRHLGVDLAMPKGTIVVSTSSGKIIKTAFNKISGFYIVLNNKNKYTTKYMHLKKILVKVGQNIKINQKIALSGNTGRTTGPHLHYEIWINKHAIDPIYAQSNFIEPLTKKERNLFFKTAQIILSKFK